MLDANVSLAIEPIIEPFRVQRDSLASIHSSFHRWMPGRPPTMPHPEGPYPELDLVPTEDPIVKRTPTTVLLSFINEITDSGAVRDGFKLIVVGGILEASRRGLGLLLRQMYYCKIPPSCLSLAECCRFSDATIEAIFTEDDPAYRWIMGWLSVPERQSDARNFEVVSTKYQEGEDGKATDMEKGNAGLALIPAFGEYLCVIIAEVKLMSSRRSSSVYSL
jgi:hypothetical protein